MRIGCGVCSLRGESTYPVSPMSSGIPASACIACSSPPPFPSLPLPIGFFYLPPLPSVLFPLSPPFSLDAIHTGSEVALCLFRALAVEYITLSELH